MILIGGKAATRECKLGLGQLRFLSCFVGVRKEGHININFLEAFDF